MSEQKPSSAPDMPAPGTGVGHKWYEDVLAVIFGALFIGMGVVFFVEARLLTGGVSGFALVLSYVTPFDFGTYFFFLNMPFYALAILRIGWRFTVKTVAAVAIVSVFPDLIPHVFAIQDLNPFFGAVFAGALVAMGMIILFRHGSGIGGVSILAHFLQEKGIMRAGWFLLMIDLTILLIGAFILPVTNLLASVVGALVMNVVVAINHRPGRYFGG